MEIIIINAVIPEISRLRYTPKIPFTALSTWSLFLNSVHTPFTLLTILDFSILYRSEFNSHILPQLRGVFRDIDLDGDGRISFDEYCELVKYNNLVEAFEVCTIDSALKLKSLSHFFTVL